MNAEAKESVVPFNYGRKVNELPSAELIRKLLDYNPETGLLTWRWHPTSPKVMRGGRAAGKKCKGYIKVKVFKVYHWAHRIAWLHYYGEPPNGLIDHMNGIPDDNRIENLRVVDYSGNQKNRKEQRRKLAVDVLRVQNCSKDYWFKKYTLNPERINKVKNKIFKRKRINRKMVSFEDDEIQRAIQYLNGIVNFFESVR